MAPNSVVASWRQTTRVGAGKQTETAWLTADGSAVPAASRDPGNWDRDGDTNPRKLRRPQDHGPGPPRQWQQRRSVARVRWPDTLMAAGSGGDLCSLLVRAFLFWDRGADTLPDRVRMRELLLCVGCLRLQQRGRARRKKDKMGRGRAGHQWAFAVEIPLVARYACR